MNILPVDNIFINKYIYTYFLITEIYNNINNYQSCQEK